MSPTGHQLEPAATSPTLAEIATLPNAITLGGFAATCHWLAGGDPAWAVAGLVADEVDGRLARATGTASEFGSLLDWSTDVVASALILDRRGELWAAPLVVGAQVALRASGWRPPLGSARALLTLWTIYQEHQRRDRAAPSRPNPSRRGSSGRCRPHPRHTLSRARP